MERLDPRVNDNFVEEFFNELVAITICPNPVGYQSYEPQDQYKSIINVLLSKNEMRHTFNHFTFYPEVTKEGNIHLHGYYKIKDKIKYHKWFLPLVKRIGFVKIKTKDITLEWVEYCQKDEELMKEMLDPEPVPYHETSIHYKDKRKLKQSYAIQKKTKKKNITDYF